MKKRAMFQKGQVVLIVVFVIVLALCALLGWWYYQNRATLGFINLPFLSKKELAATDNWKTFTIETNDLSYLYPPDWYITDQYISQYPFNPSLKNSNSIDNAISVSKITSQIQLSYANEDWFNRIYNARDNQEVTNDYRPTGEVKITKIEAGKIKTGQKYVIFTDAQYPNQVQAYVLGNNIVYQLTLVRFDDTGLGTFKTILPTVSIR